MEQLKIDLKSSNTFLETPLDAQTLKNAICVDDSNDSLVESNITISGKYNRKYKILAFCVWLNHDRVLIDGDLLIICLWANLLIIDLKEDKLIHNIDFDCWELFRIFKFKDGYFIYGEGENRFLNKNFELVWEKGCIDIFINPKVENELEIFDDYVTCFDWCGYKHYYDENGEFKTEHYPQFEV